MPDYDVDRKPSKSGGFDNGERRGIGFKLEMHRFSPYGLGLGFRV